MSSTDAQAEAHAKLQDAASRAHPGLDPQRAMHAFLAEGSDEAHELHDAWLDAPATPPDPQAATWQAIEALAARLRARQPAGSPPLTDAQAVDRALATPEGRELFERHQEAFRRDTAHTYEGG